MIDIGKLIKVISELFDDDANFRKRDTDYISRKIAEEVDKKFNVEMK